MLDLQHIAFLYLHMYKPPYSLVPPYVLSLSSLTYVPSSAFPDLQSPSFLTSNPLLTIFPSPYVISLVFLFLVFQPPIQTPSI